MLQRFARHSAKLEGKVSGFAYHRTFAIVRIARTTPETAARSTKLFCGFACDACETATLVRARLSRRRSEYRHHRDLQTVLVAWLLREGTHCALCACWT